MDTGRSESAGRARLGLEDGMTAFTWPSDDLWIFARIAPSSPGASIVASKAGRLEPSVELGQFPLATLTSLLGRSNRLFVVSSDLQSDVFVGERTPEGLSVRRLTSTPANERTTGFLATEVLAMSDASGDWSAVAIPLNGDPPRKIGPARSFTWPEPASDGALYGFLLEPGGPRGSATCVDTMAGRRTLANLLLRSAGRGSARSSKRPPPLQSSRAVLALRARACRRPPHALGRAAIVLRRLERGLHPRRGALSGRHDGSHPGAIRDLAGRSGGSNRETHEHRAGVHRAPR